MLPLSHFLAGRKWHSPLRCLAVTLLLIAAFNTVAAQSPLPQTLFSSNGFESGTDAIILTSSGFEPLASRVGPIAGTTVWPRGSVIWAVTGGTNNALIVSNTSESSTPVYWDWGEQSLQLNAVPGGVTVEPSRLSPITQSAYYDVQVDAPSSISSGQLLGVSLLGTDGNPLLQVYLSGSGGLTVNYCASTSSDTLSTISLSGTTYQWQPGLWNNITVYVSIKTSTYLVYLNGQSDNIPRPFTYGLSTAAEIGNYRMEWNPSTGGANAAYFDAYQIVANNNPTSIFQTNGYGLQNTSFGSYSVGSIDGQNGWAVETGGTANAIIEDTFAYQGSQALELIGVSGSTVRARQQLAVSSTGAAYYDVQLYTPSSTAAANGAAIQLLGSTKLAVVNVNLATNGGLRLSYITASGSTAVLGLSSTTYQWTPSAWNQITININASQELTVFLNGQSDSTGSNLSLGYGAGASGVISDVDLLWTSQTTGSSIYFDNLEITRASWAGQIPPPLSASQVMFLQSRVDGVSGTLSGAAFFQQLEATRSLIWTSLGDPTAELPPYNMFGGYYFAGFVDDRLAQNNRGHTLGWFQQYHPDWLALQSDGSPAASLPVGWGIDYNLDFTNPQVREYLLNSFLIPLGINLAFPVISCDAVTLSNNFLWTSVQGPNGLLTKFTGSGDDPAFQAAVVSYLSWLQNEVHSRGVGLMVNINTNTYADSSNNLLTATGSCCDIWVNEGGFGTYSQYNAAVFGSRHYISASRWQVIYDCAVNKQTMGGYVDLDYVLESATTQSTDPAASLFNNPAEEAWVVANFLLVRSPESYLASYENEKDSGVLDDDTTLWNYPPEFNPAIGSPTGPPIALSNGLYSRQYSLNISGTVSYNYVVVNPADSDAASNNPVNSISYTIPGTSASNYSINTSGTSILGGSSYSMPGHSGLILLALPPAAPAVPTGLTAAPANSQVALSWNSSPVALSYNVKRSLTTGAGYATVASVSGSTAYLDTGLANWTTYYYVVSAVNAEGESPNSLEANAMPQSPPITAAESGPPPMSLIASDSGGWNAVFTVNASVVGHRYQLQYCDDLVAAAWQNIGSPSPGTGALLQLTATADPLVQHRFFRLLIGQ